MFFALIFRLFPHNCFFFSLVFFNSLKFALNTLQRFLSCSVLFVFLFCQILLLPLKKCRYSCALQINCRVACNECPIHQHEFIIEMNRHDKTKNNLKNLRRKNMFFIETLNIDCFVEYDEVFETNSSVRNRFLMFGFVFLLHKVRD